MTNIFFLNKNSQFQHRDWKSVSNMCTDKLKNQGATKSTLQPDNP